MRKICLVLIPFFLSSCYLGEELPSDQQIWEYQDPATQGLSEPLLLSIDSGISVNFYERIEGLMILRNDKMVFENYYDSASRHSIISLDKASITVTVAAIGIALDEGLISLDDPIHLYLPSYQTLIDEDIRKRDITIQHLLTHRSGFSWNESIVPLFGNPDNNLNQLIDSDDWVAFILDQPLEADPGIRYNFNSGTGSILAKIVQNASGQSFEGFLSENLFEILGVSTFSVDLDPAGNYKGGRGVSLSFLDWAKFGYLMLNEGIWNGRKIIDPNFVAESSIVQTQVSPSFNLGYGWWLFGDNFDFLPINKDGIYYIAGDFGQHMYIIPDENMLVLINAENFFFGFNNPSLNLFIQITSTIQ